MLESNLYSHSWFNPIESELTQSIKVTFYWRSVELLCWVFSFWLVWPLWIENEQYLERLQARSRFLTLTVLLLLLPPLLCVHSDGGFESTIEGGFSTSTGIFERRAKAPVETNEGYKSSRHRWKGRVICREGINYNDSEHLFRKREQMGSKLCLCYWSWSHWAASIWASFECRHSFDSTEARPLQRKERKKQKNWKKANWQLND